MPSAAQTEFYGVRSNRGIQNGSRAMFALDHPDLRIVLGRVVGRRAQQIAPNDVSELLTYQVTILAEFRQSLPEDSQIMIQGRRAPQAGGGSQIPAAMQSGTLFVMGVRAIAGSDRFEYASEARLIGLDLPTTVREEEVAPLKVALLRLGEIARSETLLVEREEANRLLEMKDNYYLWALGAQALAAIGDRVAADQLLVAFRDEPLTPRQIAWIDHCVGDVLPPETAFSAAWRISLLTEYIRRLPEQRPPPPTTSQVQP